ncbi:MAG: glycosyltransferase family 2 protein [Bacteroidaceae bacterium]|nr:glycosyltransferase family 2 protein [Bacteroidaceae bacterium]
MKTLTVFTPTYNRKHTIGRTYESLCRQSNDDSEWLIIDDGSSDGTREWVESLGEKVVDKGKRFDWMGRELGGEDDNHFVVDTRKIRIEYVYKPNGGLYTGYNTAYATIRTELCVCIDSDDYMPDDAVEKIVKRWKERPQEKEYCGIVGLDFNVVDGKPIGGLFPDSLSEAYQTEVHHTGDVKQVMRADLMRRVAPQIGFKGERDFNPFYMLIQVLDKYPILISNENFCWVEYQIGADSMSQGIWKQYIRSPRSYAKYRINQMTLTHGNSWKNKFRLCAHYVSSCILSGDTQWLKTSPLKALTLLAAPFGVVLWILVLIKSKR